MRIVRKASILPLTVLAVFLVILAVSTYLIIIAGQGSPGAPATPIENPVGWAGKYTIERPYASETVPGYVSEYTYSRGYEPSEKSGG